MIKIKREDSSLRIRDHLYQQELNQGVLFIAFQTLPMVLVSSLYNKIALILQIIFLYKTYNLLTGLPRGKPEMLAKQGFKQKLLNIFIYHYQIM